MSPRATWDLARTFASFVPSMARSLNAPSDRRAVVSARSAWQKISRSPSQYFGRVSSRNLARFFRSDSVPGQASKPLSRHSGSRHRHSWSLTASALLSGGGCRHCVNELKNQPALAALVSSLSPELRYLETSRNPDFLRFSIDATGKHRAQYRYEENLFISFSRPCQVICHTHGAFKLKPEEHLGGTGCPICAYQEQFIRSARQRFADRFDYGQTQNVLRCFQT